MCGRALARQGQGDPGTEVDVGSAAQKKKKKSEGDLKRGGACAWLVAAARRRNRTHAHAHAHHWDAAKLPAEAAQLLSISLAGNVLDKSTATEYWAAVDAKSGSISGRVGSCLGR